MTLTLFGLLTRASAFSLFLSAAVQAGITHVDALGGPGGNTVNADTNSPTDWFVSSTGGPDATSTSSDKRWGERLTFVVDDLDFVDPAQKPIALKSATVGVLHANNVTTDPRGHATI